MKYYSSGASGNAGLYLSGRVYTSLGGVGVAGKTITVHVSYISGGVTISNVLTLGPTDSTGFAQLCPAAYYPASVQLTINTDPVDNAPGPNGPGLGDVQVQNQSGVPAFCQ